jgi:hypothetical protein
MINYILDFNPTDAASYMSSEGGYADDVLLKITNYMDQIGKDFKQRYQELK